MKITVIIIIVHQNFDKRKKNSEFNFYKKFKIAIRSSIRSLSAVKVYHFYARFWLYFLTANISFRVNILYIVYVLSRIKDENTTVTF